MILISSYKSAIYVEKEQEVQMILDRLTNWNTPALDVSEAATAILKKNQESMERLKSCDHQMNAEELNAFFEANQEKFDAIITKQKELIKVIKSESDHLTDQLVQMKQKSKVVNHYMSSEKSLFIDRDM